MGQINPTDRDYYIITDDEESFKDEPFTKTNLAFITDSANSVTKRYSVLAIKAGKYSLTFDKAIAMVAIKNQC